MADDTGGTDAAEALIETRRGISLVWLVPIVAVVIGGWLAYSAFASRGPSVTIAFESASGRDLRQQSRTIRFSSMGRRGCCTASAAKTGSYNGK